MNFRLENEALVIELAGTVDSANAPEVEREIQTTRERFCVSPAGLQVLKEYLMGPRN